MKERTVGVGGRAVVAVVASGRERGRHVKVGGQSAAGRGVDRNLVVSEAARARKGRVSDTGGDPGDEGEQLTR